MPRHATRCERIRFIRNSAWNPALSGEGRGRVHVLCMTFVSQQPPYASRLIVVTTFLSMVTPLGVEPRIDEEKRRDEALRPIACTHNGNGSPQCP